MRFSDSGVRVRGDVISGGWASSGQTIDWSSPDEVTYPAVVQPDREIENISGQQSVETLLRVFLPPSADIVETDRWRWRGDDYDVQKVEPWPDLSAVMHHLEIVVKKVAYSVG